MRADRLRHTYLQGVPQLVYTIVSSSVQSSVRALLPEIAAAADDVDRTGAVQARVIAGLHAAGYFALLRPPSFGGLDAEPDDYLTATRELASACMSTGWLAGWLGVNNWGLAVRG